MTFFTKKDFLTVLRLVKPVLLERASQMDFFDKWEKASQAADNLNSVYGPDTVTANQAQFWFRPFRCGNFDIKDAQRTERPIREHIYKIMDIVESVRHASTVSIAQELQRLHKKPFGAI